MAATSNSVSNRIEQVSIELTLTQILLGIALVAALGFTLAFIQEPMAHEAMHNFRHTAGITCH